MLSRISLAVALWGFVASGATAQTVDEIVAKSIAAHGGAEKLKSVQTMRLTGTMSMMGADLPIIVEQKRPKMVRVDLDVQGTINTQAYDGHMGWLFLPSQGMTSPQPAPPDVLKDLDEQSDMDLPFMDYKAKGNKVELAGKETVNGVETYKLKITLKNGDVRNYYLDTKSYLPVKSDGSHMENGAPTTTDTFISDYRDVNGLMMPHTIENRSTNLIQKVTVQKIEVNVSIDDARFKMPK